MTDRLFKCRAFYSGKIRCEFSGDNEAVKGSLDVPFCSS